MAIPFPDDAADFAKDLEQLGIRYESVEAIAGTIGYSTSHVSNLLGGGKPYAPGARTKIGEMIAKANGLGDLPGPSIANAVSRFDEPVDLSGYSGSDRFAVIDARDGTAVLVEIIEPFNNHTAARKICALLNKEAG